MKQPLLALLVLVPVPSFAVAAGLHWWPGTALGQGCYMAGKAWILILPLLWFRLTEGHLPRPRRPQGWWATGIISGLVIGAVVAAAFLLSADVLFDTAEAKAHLKTAGLSSPWVFLGFACYASLINSLIEEYVWRWFVVGNLERLVPPWLAVLGGGLCFGIHHFVALCAYAPWPTALLATTGVVIGGCWWSWLYLKAGGVWQAWISHMIVDIAIFASVWYLLG